MRTRVSGILIFLLVSFFSSKAQTFSQQEKLQGYTHRNDTTYFIFDSSAYGNPKVNRVIVTGSFRNWSQDMEDKKWNVRGWLPIFNPSFTIIPPRAVFKFRINDGEWLAPPESAPNTLGGNLVFMHDMETPTLKAELKSSGNIWIKTQGIAPSLSVSSFRLTDAKGTRIPIAEVLPNTANESLVIPAEAIDINRVYYIEIPSQHLKSWCSYDGWFRELYSSKELGANIHSEGTTTTFRIFSPRSSQVTLFLYSEKEGDEAFATHEMKKDADGVWEYSENKNLSGIYYDFTVQGPQELGNHFIEGFHISDPYARVNVGSWGRSRVWPATQPAKPLPNGRPPIEDVIAYEVHVQDFTDLLPVSESIKGTFPAMHKSGLRNQKGERIGFDHITKLGINTVHLMPVQQFMHYPEKIWKASFANDPKMKELGVDQENYQWGYRTSHAFAVEDQYREKGTEHGAEREQFRDLVQAFHDKDLAVIIDIVPNHTAENMDDTPHFFHWNVLDMVYHYRTKDLDHIGEYGNEVKTENRPMVQRWLIDQCQHWIKEFGIDGFRIDLAGQIDQQTLRKLRHELGSDIIVYGEPWIGSADPDFESNPDWDWYKENSPITYFQDGSRDAFIGSPFDLDDLGFAGGEFKKKDAVKKSLSAGFSEDKTPISGISYLDIHDNWALADRFALNDNDGRHGIKEDRYKIGAVLLYTTLGPIVTHAGVEMIRSKGAAPLEDFTKEMTDGTKVPFKSRGDTYNMRVPNQFIWENLGKTLKDGAASNYENMVAFWRGLNEFRLGTYGKVFRQNEAVPEDYYTWIDTANPYQLGYLVDNKVLVLINVGSDPHLFPDVKLPKGKWELIGNLEAINARKGVKDDKAIQTLEGGGTQQIWMEGPSFRIWVLR